jgi:hypothetical protein
MLDIIGSLLGSLPMVLPRLFRALLGFFSVFYPFQIFHKQKKKVN